MKKEIVESFFIFNGKQYTADQIEEITLAQPSVYEVIRVLDGVPLFLEDHMERLRSSAASLGKDITQMLPLIVSDIKKLIKINNSPLKNIKLLVFHLSQETPEYILCFIKSSYPSAVQYSKGVHTVLFHAERSNPNAKVLNTGLRDIIDSKLLETGAHEALLVNSQGEITEGSRSNLFFVVQDKIYTAPAQDVLIGITRKYIIQACNNIGLTVEEQPIPFSIQDYAEGAFITGTSPKVLPIATIEEAEINSADNRIVQSIMKEYDKLIQQYIKEHK